MEPIKWYSYFDGFTEVAGEHYNIEFVPTQDAVWQKVKHTMENSAAVFVCLGGTSTEGSDRTTLVLEDDELVISAMNVATNSSKLVVLVNSPGAAIMHWAQHHEINGILAGFFPGEMFGPAAADIIFGKKFPTGRLPLTMPMGENDHEFTASQYPGIREGIYGWPLISQVISGLDYVYLFGRWCYVHIFGQLEKKNEILFRSVGEIIFAKTVSKKNKIAKLILSIYSKY